MIRQRRLDSRPVELRETHTSCADARPPRRPRRARPSGGEPLVELARDVAALPLFVEISRHVTVRTAVAAGVEALLDARL